VQRPARLILALGGLGAFGLASLACAGAVNLAAGGEVDDLYAELDLVQDGPEKDAAKDLLVQLKAALGSEKVEGMVAMDFTSAMNEVIDDRIVSPTELSDLQSIVSWPAQEPGAITKARADLDGSLESNRRSYSKHFAKWSLPEDLCVRMRNLGWTTAEPYASVEDGEATYSCDGDKEGLHGEIWVYALKRRKEAKEWAGDPLTVRDGSSVLSAEVLDGVQAKAILDAACPPGTPIVGTTQEVLGKRLAAQQVSLKECDKDVDEDGWISWGCALVKGGKEIGYLDWTDQMEGETTAEERRVEGGQAEVDQGRGWMSVQVVDKKASQELLDALQHPSSMKPGG